MGRSLMNGNVVRQLTLLALLFCISTFCGCGCGVGKYISKAHTHYNRETKDAPAAIEQLNIALKKDPKNIEALMFLARIQAETKNYDAAIEAYDKILALVPTDIQMHMAEAKTYKEKGDFNKAIEHLKKVTEINPGGKLAREAEKLISECESGRSSGGNNQQQASSGAQSGQKQGGTTPSPNDKNKGGQQPKKAKTIDF